jgi:hypothetical protein
MAGRVPAGILDVMDMNIYSCNDKDSLCMVNHTFIGEDDRVRRSAIKSSVKYTMQETGSPA